MNHTFPKTYSYLFFTLLFSCSLNTSILSQIWDYTYTIGESWAIQDAGDGSLLMAGIKRDSSYLLPSAMTLHKLDRQGNLIWEQIYRNPDPSVNQRGVGMITLTDGTFLVIGNTWSSPPFVSHPKLWRLNNSGELLWELDYGDQDLNGEMTQAIPTADGNIMVRAFMNLSPGGQQRKYALKLTPTGEVLWSYEIPEVSGAVNFRYGMPFESADGNYYIPEYNRVFVLSQAGVLLNTIETVGSVEDLLVLPAGDIVTAGTYFDDDLLFYVGAIARYDSNGEQLWEHALTLEGDVILRLTEFTNSGNVIVVGDVYSLLSGVAAAELSIDGDLIWEQVFFDDASEISTTSLFSLDGEAFFVTFYRYLWTGQAYHNHSAALQINENDTEKRFPLWINTFEDINEDCLNNEATPIPGLTVKVTGNNDTYFNTTNSSGQATFALVAGTYTSELLVDTSFWEGCTPTQTTVLSEEFSFVEQDFLLRQKIPCPQLSSSISLPRMRPCFSNFLSIRVCNNSNVPLDSALITISFPEEVVQYITSIQNFAGIELTDWSFPFYNISPGSCKQASFRVLLDCDTPLSIDICLQTTLSTDFECDGNSIPNPDDQLCVRTTASYDPNDKQAQPLGMGEDHIIPPDTPLVYTINFQNTGTDTAFLVVIRDTLPTELNSASLRPGVSSHPYQLTVEKDSILIFTFPQILLPDSNVNVIGSQGYVRYDIEMQPGLPLGTIINNRAGIYFDFNDPILTEYAFHKLGIPAEVMEVTDEISALLRIYPNPAQAQVSLIYQDESAFSNLRYQIVTMDGRIIRSGSSSGKTPINIEALLPGMYFVLAWSEKSYLGAQTMVKQ